jgi:hypothetical protein
MVEFTAYENRTIEENKRLLARKARIGDVLTFCSGLKYRRIDGRRNNGETWLESIKIISSKF